MVHANRGRSGVPCLGDLAWGTHLCQFYRSQDDLIETLVPYFRSGLKRNELCVWVTAPPLELGEARTALECAIPELPLYLERGQFQLRDFREWYDPNHFDAKRVLERWGNLEGEAIKRGYEGLRVSGNMFWVNRTVRKSLSAYEAEVNRIIRHRRMIAVCTYSLGRGAENVLDVVGNHQLTLARRSGEWDVVETSCPKLEKEELPPTNEELPCRVSQCAREIEEAPRARAGFLSMLARHLRRRLAPIQNAVEVLGLLLPEEEHLLWAHVVIDRHVECLNRLVDALLDVSRVTEGRFELRWEELDLRVLLAQALDASRPLIHAHGHTLRVSLPSDPLCVSGDPVRLAQVVTSLLQYVAKYTPEGKEIGVETSREGDEAVVWVGGASVEIPARFDRFAQGIPLLDCADGGLEVGLALARRNVELHCGMIEARNLGPGKGSEFVVRLSTACPPRRSISRAPQGGKASASIADQFERA